MQMAQNRREGLGPRRSAVMAEDGGAEGWGMEEKRREENQLEDVSFGNA